MTHKHADPNNAQNLVAPRPTEPGPWPFWLTIALSTAIVAAYFITSLAVVIPAFIIQKIISPDASIEQIGQAVSNSGLVASIGLIATLPVVVGLCVLFSRLRKGITIRQYLGLRSISLKQAGGWLAALVAFSVAEDIFYTIIGAPIVHPSTIQMYQSSVFPPLLIFAIIVCAPVVEECFFRGFLFKGLMHSAIGPVGATIVTALAWAVIHTQYEWCGILVIFLGGILIGIARIRTCSILTPLLMHCAMNLIASVQLIVHQTAIS